MTINTESVLQTLASGFHVRAPAATPPCHTQHIRRKYARGTARSLICHCTPGGIWNISVHWYGHRAYISRHYLGVPAGISHRTKSVFAVCTATKIKITRSDNNSRHYLGVPGTSQKKTVFAVCTVIKMAGRRIDETLTKLRCACPPQTAKLSAWLGIIVFCHRGVYFTWVRHNNSCPAQKC